MLFQHVFILRTSFYQESVYFFIETIRPICRTLGIREYIITVVHCMHIVLLSPLLGATGGNFIIGSPFEVY